MLTFSAALADFFSSLTSSFFARPASFFVFTPFGAIAWMDGQGSDSGSESSEVGCIGLC